jgi:hypothetical protein
MVKLLSSTYQVLTSPHTKAQVKARPSYGCRYPTDRVPLRTSSKSRRRAIRVLAHAHVSMTSGYATRHRQLGCRHTPRGASSCLLARGSSGAAMCLVAPAPESRLGAARVLPRVSWRQLPPPGTGQLWSRHVSCGSSSHLLSQGSFGAATCPVAPAPASWLGAAPEPPRVRGFSSRLLAQGSSGAATCPMELYGLWVIEVNKYPPVTLPS